MALKGKTIVVTGGAGFIGSNLVERLAPDNKVYVVDRLHTGSEDNLAEAKRTGNVTFVNADSKEIAKTGTTPDAVFHLGFYSASPMYRKEPHLVAEAIAGMIAVLEFCKTTGAPLVYASTSSMYGGVKPPHREDAPLAVTDYYTETRIASERLAKLYYNQYGVPSAGMRFFSVYGKHEAAKKGYANLVTQFLWNMKKGEKPLIYGNGEQKRDFVHVDDVVDALLAGLDAQGAEIFNVGTGKNYTLNEVVAKLNAVLGTSIAPTYVPIPPGSYVMETLADTSKARELIGFKAKRSLDDGIQELLRHY